MILICSITATAQKPSGAFPYHGKSRWTYSSHFSSDHLLFHVRLLLCSSHPSALHPMHSQE